MKWAILLLTAAALPGQVWIASSPVPGNPSNMVLNIAPMTGPITMVMNANAGQLWNSCYVELWSDFLGYHVALSETSTGSLTNRQVGNYGWQSTLATSRCAIDLSQSAVNPYQGVSLRLTTASTAPMQVVASYYYRYCDEYCNVEYATNTIGYWSPGQSAYGARLISPAPGTALTSSSATFTWNAVSGAESYCFTLGSSPGAINYANVCTGQTSVTVANIPPASQQVYGVIRTYWSDGGSDLNTFSVTAADTSALPSNLQPPLGTAITGDSLTLSWTPGTNISSYRVQVGTSPGQVDIGDYYVPASQSSIQVTGLSKFSVPIIYISLQTFLGNFRAAELTRSYAKTNVTPATLSVISSPSPTNTLGAGTYTFQWTARSKGATEKAEYFLSVGRTPGGADIFPNAKENAFWGTITQSLSVSVTIPIDLGGRPIYASIYSRVCPNNTSGSEDCSNWVANSVRYLTPAGSPSTDPEASPAQLLSPSPGTILNPNYATYFLWTAGSKVEDYWITVGTSPGATNLFYSYNGRRPVELMDRRVKLDVIPSGISTIYVSLYSKIGTSWVKTDYQFPVASGTGGQIPLSFRQCVSDPNYPGTDCALSSGVYAINTSPPPTGVTLPVLNGPIAITRSNITVRAAGNVTLLRFNGCAPLVTLAPGVQSVTVYGFTVDGNNETLANTPECMHPDGGYLQPSGASDIAIAGLFTTSPLITNILLQDMTFQDAVGRGLSIVGPNVDGVILNNVSFHNNALTGLLIHGNNVELANKECVSTADPNRPKNIFIYGGLYWGSWTGALAYNSGYNIRIENAWFSQNYIDPYDGGGGTIFADVCAENSPTVPFLKTSQLYGVGLTTPTDGVEMWGKHLAMEYNIIAGYPAPGITLHSARDILIKGNQIHNNGSLSSSGSDEYNSGVHLRQRYPCTERDNNNACIGRGDLTNIRIEGNNIFPTTIPACIASNMCKPGFGMQFTGIRFGQPGGIATVVQNLDLGTSGASTNPNVLFFGPVAPSEAARLYCRHQNAAVSLIADQQFSPPLAACPELVPAP